MTGFSLFMWYLLIATAITICIVVIDDFFIDFVYFIYSLYRKWKFRRFHYKPLTYEELIAVPEKKIAVMVPCWHEHLVIEQMLNYNVLALNYNNYDFFVGVYPNDKPTIHSVNKAQSNFKNIHCVVTDHVGPTTKADNLNSIYNYIQEYEKEKNITYDIFVLHDSEDVIHPLSFKAFNFLIPRKDMIQIPVFPLEVNHFLFTHWTYNDEFAENHTKIMIVREVIKGFIPSAGVGTALSRNAIQKLGEQHNGIPFDVACFTEDYSIALRLHLLNLKSIFLTQAITRTQTTKKWRLFGSLKPKRVKEIIATRALFPKKYYNAVRQRARWIIGISLQEWSHTGWPGNLATRFTLFHDRKSLASHFINLIAYVVFFYWLFYYFLNIQPTINIMFEIQPWTYTLIIICTIFMILRLLFRAMATYKIYGLTAAILSVPRSVYGNIINFHALLRALAGFFLQPHKKITWDKTANVFPTATELRTYKRKLGDLLIENKLINSKILYSALNKQKKTHEKLGTILIKEHSLNPAIILDLIAKQYNLNVINMDTFKILTKQELEPISQENYDWLLKNEIFPVSYVKDIVTVAICDPANEAIYQETANRLSPKEVKFALSSNAINIK